MVIDKLAVEIFIDGERDFDKYVYVCGSEPFGAEGLELLLPLVVHLNEHNFGFIASIGFGSEHNLESSSEYSCNWAIPKKLLLEAIAVLIREKGNIEGGEDIQRVKE